MRIGPSESERRWASAGLPSSTQAGLTSRQRQCALRQSRQHPHTGGVLVNNYTPIIADASATYKLDSFPLYPGAFPIKLAGEYINNVGAIQNNNNNQGYWGGITFGKSGKKHTWDISYRYEYLEADAIYDQLVDDDNGAYYQNAPTGGAVGYYSGTNMKGSLIKANYSITDSLTFTFSCFLNDLINPGLNTSSGEPKNRRRPHDGRPDVEILTRT
jgi:hypothetical protein